MASSASRFRLRKPAVRRKPAAYGQNPGRGPEATDPGARRPFLVFRDKVPEDLKLSDEQKQKLLEKLPDYVQETMKVFGSSRT